MDVEVAHKTAGKTRFEKALAILIGCTAIMAALLATLEMHSNKRWEQASTKAADLSVELFGKIAASGPVTSAGVSAQQTALLTSIESTARSSQPQTGELELILGYVDSRVGARLLKLGEAISAPPDADSGLDPLAREVVTTKLDELSEVSTHQREQVEASERYGSRLSRALFSLSLLALAAVLLGLAAILGAAHGGAITLGAATVALLVAGAWGGSALLI